MSANTDPIYSKVADVQWAAAAVTAANTAKDGTGTVSTVFTAAAADSDGCGGGFVQEVRAQPLGSNIATVLRVFLNNGSTNATAANNILIAEASLLATTLNEAGALQPFLIPINRAIPPGYKLNVVLGTAVAAGYAVSAWGGKYV